MPMASLERLFQVDAESFEPAVDPPAPPGDLMAEIDRFTTIEACVKQHARIDPLVGDALESIGYDTFLGDACRVLDAVKARDDKRCEAIDASPLRERCEATVAEIIGDADACPWQVSTRPDRGRDASCVAIALREPRLCSAVERGSALCEAMTTHDPARCNTLLSAAERARCTRHVQRYGRAIPAADVHNRRLPASAGRLQVSGADGGLEADMNLAPDLAGGVVLLQRHDGVHLLFGALSEAGLGFIAPSPHVRATFAFELLIPVHKPHDKLDSPPAEARVERFELLLPGHAPVSTQAERSGLVAKIDELVPERGGEVSLSITGELDDARSGHARDLGLGSRGLVHANLTTFVRDVVKASAIYGEAMPRLGGDGGMR
jgi:hypothetical protein